VVKPGVLRGTEVAAREIPGLIDEIPFWLCWPRGPKAAPPSERWESFG